MGIPCSYTKLDASAFDPASLKIMEQLSVIEALVRNIQIPSSLGEEPSSSSRTQLWQSLLALPATRGSNASDTDCVTTSFNLEPSFKAATDKILQWPIFERLLSSCQRFQIINFHGAETYTYLDDIFTQSKPSTSQSPGNFLTNRNRGTHISSEREDIEVLVDRFFKRVNNKNPILSRRIVTQYCQSYYEDGPRFDLETCIVLLTCALGAVAMEYSPPDATSSPTAPARFSSSRLEDLQLGYCYFAAAEKRLGPAMTEVSTQAIQCLCLAGYVHHFNESEPALLAEADPDDIAGYTTCSLSGPCKPLAYSTLRGPH
jgi:hypothetical protein